MLALAACSTAPILIPQADQYSAQIQPQPDSSHALVYFYNHPTWSRTAFSETAPWERYAILEGDQDGKEISVIGCGSVGAVVTVRHLCAGTYSWVLLPPGRYSFTAMFIEHRGNGITSTFNLLGAHTYYIKVTQYRAAYSQDITLTQESADTAVQAIEGYKYCHDVRVTVRDAILGPTNDGTCDIPSKDTYSP